MRVLAYTALPSRLLSKLVSTLIVTVVRKRQFRQLWIARINAAARQNGISYSKFINGLKKPLLKSTVRSWLTSPYSTN